MHVRMYVRMYIFTSFLNDIMLMTKRYDHLPIRFLNKMSYKNWIITKLGDIIILKRHDW